jgi:hypothetical protein
MDNKAVATTINIKLFIFTVVCSGFLIYDMVMHRSLIRIFIKYFALHVPIAIFLAVFSIKLMKSVNRGYNIAGIVGIVLVWVLLIGPFIF